MNRSFGNSIAATDSRLQRNAEEAVSENRQSSFGVSQIDERTAAERSFI